jgi:acetyl esterase/lipase
MQQEQQQQHEEEKDRLLLFVHGGGYVGPSADAIDDVFIKDWAGQLAGITILNVDVSLAPEHPFPAPLQELLDLYLWLTSHQESVKDQIGFHPRQIVLCGDSSGGNLVAALTTALNDLRHRSHREQDHNCIIRMPVSLVCFVPKLSLDFDVFPSSLMSVIDPLINPLFQVKAAAAYVPFLHRQADGISSILLSDNHELPLNWLSDENFFPIKSHYLSPLHYERMNELADVNLHILAFNFDPFLDESISLCTKWKGNVDLELLEGVCHAGFYFKLLSRAASHASDKAVQMILRSFSRPSAHVSSHN